MNEETIHKYNYILNQLGKRILPQYFYVASPEKSNLWQNQICRQSHVVACYFLDKWLNSNGKSYNVEFFESIFKGNLNGIYDHSWVFITNINDLNDTYLCDIARVSEHIGFVKSLNTPDIHLKEDKEIIEKRKSFDFKNQLKEREYYSNKTGVELIQDIENRLEQCRLVLL